MNTQSVFTLVRAALAASLVLASSLAGAATVTVNLTAQRMSTTLPDGSTVPMWGYCGTGSCTAAWAPGPTITAAAGDTLTITLTNNLPVPSSLVVLGQFGGGLGTPTRMPSPAHPGQNFTTFPGNSAASPAFVPPVQTARVMSFATEVAPAGTTPKSNQVGSGSSLTWSNLKPGTYLYETGTLPSIQAPMGLYGVLIVTQPVVPAVAAVPPVAAVPFAPGVAYPAFGGRTAAVGTYDADVSLLFSEIDPVQNTAVDAAALAGTDVNKRFNDPSCTAAAPCYPAAVNYTPTAFLINGLAFDKTNPQASALTVPGTYSSGNVLLRMVNAGSRTHVPSLVGMSIALIAEDGNVAPGNPKTQNEVLLTAGKTHDALIKPPSQSNLYSAATFPLFDRSLSLTTNNQLDGGMRAFLSINGGGGTGTAGVPAALQPTAKADTFTVPSGSSNMTIGNVLANDVGIKKPVPFGPMPAGLSLDPNTGLLHAIGSTNITTPLTFTYCGNGDISGSGLLCATVTVTPTGAGGPVANNDTYTSPAVGIYRQIAAGVLSNDTDPSGLKLQVDLPLPLNAPNTCAANVNADGSFTASKPVGSNFCTFSYKVKNSVGVVSTAAATVTVNFPAAGSGLTVALVDAQSGTAMASDYRWIIQEDLTFKHDTTGTPALNARTIGTSFHRSHMPVVATGCVGAVSCGDGQKVRGAPISAQPTTDPGGVYLDPTKNYFISVLPGDAALVNGAATGHMMGGSEIKPGQTAVSLKLQASPLVPAQLSVFIYEDNSPTNGQVDGGEIRNGLGGFNMILFDPAGRVGDPAGQQTYDAFNMPLSNALLGMPGCPNDSNSATVAANAAAAAAAKSAWLAGHPNDTVGAQAASDAITAKANMVGVIYTCPNIPDDKAAAALAADLALNANGGVTTNRNALAAAYTLAGHALIKNLTPARYDVIAHPAAARQGVGEIWWQTETLEGTAAQDAFVGIKEPVYFQEFGPPGFHTTIGFVNPDHVTAAGADLLKSLAAGTPTYSISGKITSQHMSHPSDVRLWDSGSYDLLKSTTCQVALNSQAGDGPSIAITQCKPDGTFTLTGAPAGVYEVVIWDQWLDQIIQRQAVTVVASNVALGNIPVLSWFTQYDQNMLLDTLGTGLSDPATLPGISNLRMTSRYRNGSIHMQTLTDSSGNGVLAEMFPLFNWYVVEADTTRFKQSGVQVNVDGGGKVDGTSVDPATGQVIVTGTGPSAGLWSSTYATGESSVRTEVPGAISYGLQSFISQRNTINWLRTPYARGENGGIQGTVVLSVTRPFDEQRYNVQNIWAPLVPRVTVKLYQKVKNADGTQTLTLVDSTKTSSFDDYVNLVYDTTCTDFSAASTCLKYLVGTDGSLSDPATGTRVMGKTAGKQVNMSCPGQLSTDPFYQYTLALDSTGTIVDGTRCYDGWHNWNQVQAAPYDGRYQFPSKTYMAAHPLCTGTQTPATTTPACTVPNPGQTLVSLPLAQYVVEAETPAGYEIVKEEDKNILIGDSFVAPAATQFGSLGSVFILPDQATLNNANPYNPSTGDAGFQSNPTTDLGSTLSKNIYPECVGNLHRVPDFLSIYPQAQQVAPFAGMDRALCDRKMVNLGDQMQAVANFFVYTAVPMASNNTGIILDDASSEFNAVAPDFGEKASVPFVPVSIKDFNGQETIRTYSDQWGAYNVMTPSSWLVNPPTPSGYGPNMMITCMNDPGPILDTRVGSATNGQMITDPAYNPAYSNFCYTFPFMPGLTDYLDTPVLPIAAFASGYNPADCEYPNATPAISRVDSSVGIGPYLPATGGTLTIKALGDRTIMNPAYAGPFAKTTSDPNGPDKRQITRHYGFGSNSLGIGSVTLNGVPLIVSAGDWTDVQIKVQVPANAIGGELVITADNGRSSVDTVTVTVGGTAPKRVPADYATIQAAIDAATPGDLVLVDAGTYNELVIMWKPVRLQGVGAASVIINAAKYPNDKVQGWRDRVNALFSINMVTGNPTGTAQVDPLPTQEITGGVVLLEPSVLGTEEGAGITVLAKNLPAGQCAGGAISTNGAAVTDSNFLCAASRIDGVSVTGGDSGGGIYVNGWAHNLEIANNRVYGNAGAFNGGVRVGIPYLQLESLPTDAQGNVTAFGYDKNVKIHHNAITRNGTIEGPAGNGGAGGGVSICTGTDGYSVDHNWVCGNNSASDGGGIGHIGFSQGGKIANNTVLFNQSFQQTTSTHGGGIYVGGEPPVAGTLSLGTGSLTIDANVIRGNFAEGGQGGGIRLQQVNGADVAAHPATPAKWFAVTVTNNMIDNNVAAWAGGGISLSDTLKATIVNNTVSANDTTGTAGVVLSTVGAVALPAQAQGTAGVGHPMPSGIAAELTSAALKSRVNQPFSNPTLTNNIVWKNRSFYYSGDGRLCAANVASPLPPCAVLPNQSTTGQEVAGAAYWEIGVFGDTSPTPGLVNKLDPTYSIMTSTTGYNGAGNNTGDPKLLDMYFNGSRVTPEFGTVTNPPSVLNLQVAATVDEGNNYVNVRYGPLYLSKPGASATFGDYHLVDTPPSPAIDAGATVLAVTRDFDGRGRPQGVAYDIGAHEVAKVGVSPSALAFGNQLVLTTSTPQTVTLSNPRPIALAVGSVTLTGANAADFSFVSGCPANLAAGQSCNISVTFTPSLLGAKLASLMVNTPAFGAFNVALSGAGTGPLYSVTPASLSFPNTVVATTSSPLSVTVRNNQTAPMSFTQVALNGLLGVQYAIATGTTCNTTTAVASGGTCVVNVTFNPQAVFGFGGIRPANLALTAAALQTNVALRGTAILFPVDITPKGGLGVNATLSFLNTQIGQASAARTATLTNYQSTPVTFNSIAMPAQFQIVTGAGTTCTNGSTVAANGGTCTIAIQFAPISCPTVLGVQVCGQLRPWMQRATLTLGGSPVVNPTITLTGTATGGTVGFTATSLPLTGLSFTGVRLLTFGERTGPVSTTVTINNSGTAPVTYGSASVTGTAYSKGADSCNGTTVVAGGNCTIVVNIDGGVAGNTTTKTGTLSVPTTAPNTATNNPAVLNLTGS